ncbi:MAG: phenylacetate--CoA ligase family protein [Chloroflexi bacterium]|nr:phenylacetate--CoA ligase family protein [Chloroflexota bacterium]
MSIATILSVLPTLRQLRKQEHWTREQLEAHQAQTLNQLRAYVYQHSPFYQQFHHGLLDRSLSELPVLTKSMMMEHFDDLVTDRTIHLEDVRAHMNMPQTDQQYLDRYWVTATSGSSGHPGFFLFNRSEWAIVIGSFARGQEWGGLKVNLLRRRKMAVVASTTALHMSFRVGMTVQSPWMKTLRLAAAEPLPSIVEKLNDFQPDVLVAYASMARILAEEQHAGRLRIKPTVIFSSSEVLTDETRRRVEDAWGKILFNEYVATESGGLAAERSDHRGQYVFEDLVIFEIVDDQNRPVPPGVYGDKVLLTALFNRTQPLIRYELHDSIKLASEPYSTDFPFALIDGIQGRTEDTLYFPGAKGGEVAVHPNVFHPVMDTVPTNGWQINQDTNGLTLLLAGVRGSYSDDLLVQKVEQALGTQGIVIPHVTVQRVEAIPKGASGKAPLIKSHLAHVSPKDLQRLTRVRSIEVASQ